MANVLRIFGDAGFADESALQHRAGVAARENRTGRTIEGRLARQRPGRGSVAQRSGGRADHVRPGAVERGRPCWSPASCICCTGIWASSPNKCSTFSISVPDARYPEAKQVEFNNRLLERLRTLPGVTSVAEGVPLPLTGSQMTVSFDIEERTGPRSNRPDSDIAIVTPDYFHTLGIPAVGRTPVHRARRCQGAAGSDRQSGICRQVLSGRACGRQADATGRVHARWSQAPMREIVGVVGNASTNSALSSTPILSTTCPTSSSSGSCHRL